MTLVIRGERSFAANGRSRRTNILGEGSLTLVANDCSLRTIIRFANDHSPRTIVREIFSEQLFANGELIWQKVVRGEQLVK